jgi:hypothetical protein
MVRRFTDSRPGGQCLADAVGGIHPDQSPFMVMVESIYNI